ncbi:IS256 family transposase [Planktothrix sp. FACHB-1355]|uniref:IS256 family transposase n=1 Tax=Planktothrix sp. FACHB-1355 TaxID=2692854 RepID=UPI00168B3159|nr:IS256 family transposase [Planktothrix sp. FACHB-1355]MBD3557536.1 IS256 family transposase [Planktothrix sp. FACHB-1355]MBD3885894.1 IS256 family transposase [Phormidium tenue FACHB-886]
MDITQEEKLKALASELAKDIKTGEDLSALSSQLVKLTVEAALGAEMERHLGYRKHSAAGHHSGNSRNGTTGKILKGDHGEVRINTPRDRNGTFEPELIRKGQTRLTGMDEQILCLYAKGLSTREIVAAFQEMYGAEVSAGLISQVTNAVLEQVREWQLRTLDEVYPIVYFDCLVVKLRQDKRVIKKAIYLALGVGLDGQKELLGMWISETEGARFWLSILTELRNRGVEQILIACMDGLKGFPEAVEAEYPEAKVQLCIIHQVRNSLRYVAWKDYKQVAADLKQIYRSVTEEEALLELERFAQKWDEKYPQITKSWRSNWLNLRSIFDYSEEIRKVIYTTNAIESLNSVIRKATRKRKVFPTDDSALKVVFLATQAAAQKWTMPIKDWRQAMNRFAIEFEEQLAPYL